MMTAKQPAPEHSRVCRRWPHWLAAGVVALFGLLTMVFWLDQYLEERDWREACAEADWLDPGWRWDDLLAARPNPPDDRNIAVRISAVRRLIPEHWPDWG